MDSVKIGKYLAELQKSYKVKQDELALRLGVSRKEVSRRETDGFVLWSGVYVQWITNIMKDMCLPSRE